MIASCHASVRSLISGNDDAGQSLIELAFVLPTFFLLVFGLFQFSIILCASGNIAFASGEGARYASVGSLTSPNPSSASSIVNVVTPLLWGVPANQLTISTTWPGGNIVGQAVQVSITAKYQIQVPFITLAPITIASSAQRTIVH